jgi:hypothetical protein
MLDASRMIRKAGADNAESAPGERGLGISSPLRFGSREAVAERWRAGWRLVRVRRKRYLRLCEARAPRGSTSHESELVRLTLEDVLEPYGERRSCAPGYCPGAWDCGLFDSQASAPWARTRLPGPRDTPGARAATSRDRPPSRSLNADRARPARAGRTAVPGIDNGATPAADPQAGTA